MRALLEINLEVVVNIWKQPACAHAGARVPHVQRSNYGRARLQEKLVSRYRVCSCPPPRNFRPRSADLDAESRYEAHAVATGPMRHVEVAGAEVVVRPHPRHRHGRPSGPGGDLRRRLDDPATKGGVC